MEAIGAAGSPVISYKPVAAKPSEQETNPARLLFPEKAPRDAGNSASPSYRACLIKSEDDLNCLLAQMRRQDDTPIEVLSTPALLQTGDLLKAVRIKALDQVITSPGKLLDGKKCRLLVDFRSMPPSEVAELNSLFDTPPTLHGDRIHPNIEITSIISQAMVDAAKEESDAGLGGDFWRRISKSGGNWKIAKVDPKYFLNNILNEQVPQLSDPVCDGTEPYEIVFPYNQNWKTLLCGGPGLDSQGNIQFIPGELELSKKV